MCQLCTCDFGKQVSDDFGNCKQLRPKEESRGTPKSYQVRDLLHCVLRNQFILKTQGINIKTYHITYLFQGAPVKLCSVLNPVANEKRNRIICRPCNIM